VKKTFERRRNLPSFRLELADLEALCSRVRDLFGAGARVELRLSVRLPRQEFVFEKLSEIRECKELPPSLRDFDLYVYVSESGDERRLTMSSCSSMGSPGYVRATGPDEAWCAGAVEVVHQFVSQFRVWYTWFRGWVLGIMVACVVFAPWLPILLTPLGLTSEQVLKGVDRVYLLVAFVVLWTLFGFRGRLLPSGVLFISTKERWWRRYMPEMTFALTLGLFIIALIDLFSRH
jgi:hypothetical protein